MCLFSSRSQMISKSGKNKKVAHEAQSSVSLMWHTSMGYTAIFGLYLLVVCSLLRKKSAVSETSTPTCGMARRVWRPLTGLYWVDPHVWQLAQPMFFQTTNSIIIFLCGIQNKNPWFFIVCQSWCSVFSSRGEEFALSSEHSPAPWR